MVSRNDDDYGYWSDRISMLQLGKYTRIPGVKNTTRMQVNQLVDVSRFMVLEMFDLRCIGSGGIQPITPSNAQYSPQA
jgi:hypothetical protein